MRRRQAWEEAIRSFLLVAAPVFPHLTEELWTERALAGRTASTSSAGRQFDEAVLVQAQVTIVVQVNVQPIDDAGDTTSATVELGRQVAS